MDTIYRQTVPEEDEEEDTEMKKESQKINEYLTYNWFEDSFIYILFFFKKFYSSLRSNDDQESFWSEYAGSTMQKHWICPYCNEDILVTVAERVAHENRCQLNCKNSIGDFEI